MKNRSRVGSIAMAAVAVCTALADPGPKTLALAAEAVPELSAQEIFKRVSPSVMVVESLDAGGNITASGSGVVIAPGRVITNRHVIEDGASFKIKHGAVEWSAQLIRVDADHDLAELSVAGLDAPAVQVRESSTLVVGEKVYAIGAPEGLELTISEGLISGLREFDEGRVIQTSAAISPGSSGGGLFDAEGRLVGITTFYLKEGQSLNFALPAQWTLALDRQPVNTGLSSNKSSGKFQALTWNEVGLKAYLSGDYKTTLRAYQEAIRLDPGEFGYWYDVGEAYILLGNYEKALDPLQEALRLKPSWGPIWIELGTTYINLNDPEKALNAYQEAVRLEPDNAHAWDGLGQAYGDLREYERALAALRESVRLKPDVATSCYNLGLIYAAIGDRSEVIKIYEKLKVLDPELADRFFERNVLP